ncbi:MAG: Holliday junction resolvase RuvX [Candidatus Dormibacterales bacterium]
MLAVDPGSKRVGLAVSDELGITAQPLASIPAEPAEDLPGRLAAVAKELGAAEVVVGLPRRLDGSEGPEARGARDLAASLGAAAGLPVTMVDERLTTAAAERHLVRSGLRRARRREVVDEVAAVIILQGFLATRAPRAGTGRPDA